MGAARILMLAVMGLSLGCTRARLVASADPSDWVDGYAACNLRVLKGNEISWVNWQGAPGLIVVGTPLQALPRGSKVVLREPKEDALYTLDLGSKKQGMLDKFFSQTAPDRHGVTRTESEKASEQGPRAGMSKQAVYVAMGPPVTILGRESKYKRTNESTYEEILAADIWVYAVRRASQNIEVTFSASSGRVVR